MAQPKPLAVVDQHLDRRAPPIPKAKHCAREGILPKRLFAQLHQPVDPLAEVGRRDGHQDLHLRRDREHHGASRKLRPRSRSRRRCSLSARRAGGPRQSSHSMTHSWTGTGIGGNSSKCGSVILAVCSRLNTLLQRIVIELQDRSGAVHTMRGRQPDGQFPQRFGNPRFGFLVRRQAANRSRPRADSAGISPCFLLAIASLPCEPLTIANSPKRFMHACRKDTFQRVSNWLSPAMPTPFPIVVLSRYIVRVRSVRKTGGIS